MARQATIELPDGTRATLDVDGWHSDNDRLRMLLETVAGLQTWPTARLLSEWDALDVLARAGADFVGGKVISMTPLEVDPTRIE